MLHDSADARGGRDAVGDQHGQNHLDDPGRVYRTFHDGVPMINDNQNRPYDCAILQPPHDD